MNFLTVLLHFYHMHVYNRDWIRHQCQCKFYQKRIKDFWTFSTWMELLHSNRRLLPKRNQVTKKNQLKENRKFYVYSNKNIYIILVWIPIEPWDCIGSICFSIEIKNVTFLPEKPTRTTEWSKYHWGGLMFQWNTKQCIKSIESYWLLLHRALATKNEFSNLDPIFLSQLTFDSSDLIIFFFYLEWHKN